MPQPKSELLSAAAIALKLGRNPVSIWRAIKRLGLRPNAISGTFKFYDAHAVSILSREMRSFNGLRKSHADKIKARSAVATAVEAGKLPHPSTLRCEHCGHIGCDRTHQYHHHLGYSAEHHLSVQAL